MIGLEPFYATNVLFNPLSKCISVEQLWPCFLCFLEPVFKNKIIQTGRYALIQILMLYFHLYFASDCSHKSLLSCTKAKYVPSIYLYFILFIFLSELAQNNFSTAGPHGKVPYHLT